MVSGWIPDAAYAEYVDAIVRQRALLTIFEVVVVGGPHINFRKEEDPEYLIQNQTTVLLVSSIRSTIEINYTTQSTNMCGYPGFLTVLYLYRP